MLFAVKGAFPSKYYLLTYMYYFSYFSQVFMYGWIMRWFYFASNLLLLRKICHTKLKLNYVLSTKWNYYPQKLIEILRNHSALKLANLEVPTPYTSPQTNQIRNKTMFPLQQSTILSKWLLPSAYYTHSRSNENTGPKWSKA